MNFIIVDFLFLLIFCIIVFQKAASKNPNLILYYGIQVEKLRHKVHCY